MAKQLEVSLYKHAQSFEEYMDMSTLKQRLQRIAMQVSRRTRGQPNASSNTASDLSSIDAAASFSSQNSGRDMGRGGGRSSYMDDSGIGGSNRMVNMNDINPMSASTSNSANPSIPTPQASAYNQRNPMNENNGHRNITTVQSLVGNRNDPDFKAKIRHKQQRLLLLHHSAKCTAPEGKCTTTSHCSDMKRLWKHMEVCKDNNCNVPHCFSSRAILSHYRKCKDPSCPACGPVRETVRRSKMSSSNRGPGHEPSSSNGMPSVPYPGAQDFAQSSFRPSSVSNMPPPQPSVASHQPTPSVSDGFSERPSEPMDSRNGSGKGDSEWQKIRHRQQRLLLLRHASRCKHEGGTCPVTPHCAGMKKLWAHIAACKDQQCKVNHCLSSRYVLSHFRRCKDSRCPVCGPVRDTIKKQQENQNLQENYSGIDSRSINGIKPTISSPEEYHQPERKKVKVEHQSSTDTHSGRTGFAASEKSGKGDGAKGATPGQHGSLVGSFTVKDLEVHLQSLERTHQLPPAILKTKCLEVLKGLQIHQHGWVFNTPVDPVQLGLPDYFDVIKKPMDLGTIQKRLEKGDYHSVDAFKADVYLTFNNAMTYNEPASVVHDMAKELKSKFQSDMKKFMVNLNKEDQQRRQNQNACTLCGCEKLLFEPPVYFCNGMTCPTQRIRRNSHFYVGGNGQYFWCTPCYNELDGKTPIELADTTIMKSDLTKKKNDEQHEENWVQCDTCQRWVHQICGLFNTRQNKDHHSEYNCPRCLLKIRQRSPPEVRPEGARELPRTVLSEWLEQHIEARISSRKRELAEEISTAQSVPLSQALEEVESGGPVIVRQVTAMDRKLEVREGMLRRYGHKKYPKEFPFRCKCIVVFQELDGVDVFLFALYVYEHGEDNPPPNQRVVYISYLDSVHFMRPRKLRTFIYHEILIAYLDYVRRKGFATAHIWACPPLKGDDYIFHVKPEDQKTPKDNRLRQWYIDMLAECQRRNVVGKVTNMYDLYLTDENLDATAIPYLEGDYFPGEAENIIREIEEGGGKKGISKKKGSKKSQGGTGTRSSGMDEEAMLLSGAFGSLKDLDRDQVMVKLGDCIQPMKESFIVAFLNWSGARKEDMVIPDHMEKAKIEFLENDHHDVAGSKRDVNGNVRDLLAKQTSKDGKPIKVIDDDAEDLDCEFLNNRQAFLNLCRGNHYQFDDLRRAKHTSMMILWHLHNKDAAKFVQACVSCSREILSGKRYHCNTCQDYDLCHECFSNPATNRGKCSHKLVPIAVDADGNQDRSGLTEEERKQRQRNIMLHIQLIEHASRCTSRDCGSSNCAKMKQYLKHSQVCKTKVNGGCRICKRIWTLLRFHAQKCKDSNCPIPQCGGIREKMRQLQKQQQAMDDRRRIEMNRHMRFSMTGAH